MSETNPILTTESEVIAALRTCYDPEIPVNIYDLGLIYGLKVQDTGGVSIQMTLTAPTCPVAGSLPGQVESLVRAVPGVKEVKVDLVWDPPWNPNKMSDAAKLQLGMDMDFPEVGPSSGLHGIGDRRR